MHLQLGQYRHLEQLLEGAEPARQREEGVAGGRHQGLALGHGFDEVQLGQPVVADLVVDKEARQDAHDLTPARERCAGYLAHQSDLRPAVDHRDAGVDEQLADRAGRRGVLRAMAMTRRAIDADAAEGRRFARWAHWRRPYLANPGLTGLTNCLAVTFSQSASTTTASMKAGGAQSYVGVGHREQRRGSRRLSHAS